MSKKHVSFICSFTLLFLPLYSHAMFSTAARSFAAVCTKTNPFMFSSKTVGSLLAATRHTTSNSFTPDTINQQSNVILSKFYSHEKIAQLNKKIEDEKKKAEAYNSISVVSCGMYFEIIEGFAQAGATLGVISGVVMTCFEGDPFLGALTFIGCGIGIPGAAAIVTSPLAITGILTIRAEDRSNKKISQLKKAIQDEHSTKQQHSQGTEINIQETVKEKQSAFLSKKPRDD